MEVATTDPSVTRVLFVDDDEFVLAGLRRSLRRRLAGWELLFAESGARALEILDATPVDVVVSDMRMPQMDGAQLLAEVRRRRPSTGRVILSGQADRDSVVASADSAHQFLFKPCDVDTLVAALARLVTSREVLEDEAVADLVASIDHLPVLPHVYHRIVEVTRDPEHDLKDVARVIAGDMAASAGLLKLVNSAFFGFPRKVDSVDDAVRLLGTDIVTSVVLAESLFRPEDLPDWLDGDQLRERSMLTGQLARAIAIGEGWSREEADLVSLAGLLRDVGMLVLAQREWPDAAEKLDDSITEPWLRAEREYEVFGCRVATVSAGLLSLWGFPEVVVHAVAAQPALPFENGVVLAEHVVAFAHERLLSNTREHVGDAADGSLMDTLRVTRWNTAADSLLESRDRNGDEKGLA